jgi:hypothetical protein
LIQIHCLNIISFLVVFTPLLVCNIYVETVVSWQMGFFSFFSIAVPLFRLSEEMIVGRKSGGIPFVFIHTVEVVD